MSENKSVTAKTGAFLTSALKAVRGENTQSLVEDFTSEMTLVAEGLCEDQARARARMETIERSAEQNRQHVESELQSLEETITSNHREAMDRIKTLSGRLDALEKQQEKSQKDKEKEKKHFSLANLMTGLIVLAAIVCGSWVLVTVLGMFRQ